MDCVEFIKARLDEDEMDTWLSGRVYPSFKALRQIEAMRAILKFHEDWPVMVEEAEPSLSSMDYNYDPLSIDSYIMTMHRKIAWMTEKEYVKKFGVAPPTTPMLAAIAKIWSTHPDYQENWT